MRSRGSIRSSLKSLAPFEEVKAEKPATPITEKKEMSREEEKKEVKKDYKVILKSLKMTILSEDYESIRQLLETQDYCSLLHYRDEVSPVESRKGGLCFTTL